MVVRDTFSGERVGAWACARGVAALSRDGTRLAFARVEGWIDVVTVP